MKELTAFLNMLAHSNEEFSKIKTGKNVGEDLSCTIVIRDIEIYFDKEGKFNFMFNKRCCENMKCLKKEIA